MNIPSHINRSQTGYRAQRRLPTLNEPSNGTQRETPSPAISTYNTIRPDLTDGAADAMSTLEMAGALGFEPRLSVLETDVLPLTPCPSQNDTKHRASDPRTNSALYFTSL